MQTDSRGIGLVVVLGVLMLTILLALAAVNFTLSNFSLFNYAANAARASNFAEAGIQKAMYKIKNEADPTIPVVPPWSFAGQPITITIGSTPSQPNTYDVTSAATYKNANKIISAKVFLDGTTVKLLEWEQKN